MDRLVPELRLPPVLDAATAGPLVAELSALRGGPVSIDASAVERLGGLCLQALLSARKTWAADGQSFSLSAGSAPFRETLALCGAETLLESGT